MNAKTRLPTFKAAISDAQMRKIEEAARSFDTARRITAAALTRSKAELLGKCDAETMQAMLLIFQQITGYIEHLDAMHEMADKAAVRMRVVMETALRRHPELANVRVEA